MKKGILTVKLTAELFGVSIQTIRRWSKKGKLKCIRHPINHYRLYLMTDLQKIIGEMEEL